MFQIRVRCRKNRERSSPPHRAEIFPTAGNAILRRPFRPCTMQEMTTFSDIGDLPERAANLEARLSECDICPRMCRVNRNAG